MDSIVREDAQRLAAESGGRCVSLYMPTHRALKYNARDPLQFKNMLKKAAELLVRDGLRNPEVEGFLRPAHSLLADQNFWQNLSDGFAVFIGEQRPITYFRLPVPFESTVHLGDRYHVKPLLPLFAEDGRFYVLALSQGDVRLLQGTRYSVSAIELRNVTTSLKTAMKYEEYTHLQRHQRTASGSAPGRGQVSFHGEGVGMDDRKDDILHFFQQVDKGVHEYLRAENAPLVLAGVEYLMPIYRAANTYPHLIKETVRGNPDGLSAPELHSEAWDIVKPYFQQARREAFATFMHLYGSSDRSRISNNLAEIIPAADAGRVGVLFIVPGACQWGRYNPCTNSVAFSASETNGDDDLCDLAIVRTILHNGKVFFLDSARMIPDNAPAAAIYRY